MFKKFFASLFVFICFSALIVFPVLAGSDDEQGAGSGPLVPCGRGDSGAFCTICDLFVLARNVIMFILVQVVPPIAAIMVLVSGVFMLVSAGDPKKITTAKAILVDTIMGLFIIYASFLIIMTLIMLLAESGGASTYFGLNGQFFRIDCTGGALIQ